MVKSSRRSVKPSHPPTLDSLKELPRAKRPVIDGDENRRVEVQFYLAELNGNGFGEDPENLFRWIRSKRLTRNQAVALASLFKGHLLNCSKLGCGKPVSRKEESVGSLLDEIYRIGNEKGLLP